MKRRHRAVWTPARTLTALLFGVGVASSACGTSAVGVEDCQAIELVRCEEAHACGTVEDVEACRRFYRSHCLHGLPLAARPPRDERDACIEAIRSAGACAREEGPETPLSACPDGAPAVARPERTLNTTCDVVARPWDATACAFLTETKSEDPKPGEGGAGGAG